MSSRKRFGFSTQRIGRTEMHPLARPMSRTISEHARAKASSEPGFTSV
jgi:hypothetical protein